MSENTQTLPERFLESMNRGEPLTPTDDRSRMRAVMNNLVLHLHPSKVSARSLKLTYTWGLGGTAILLSTVLVITGIMLLFVYTPSPDQAYQDMQALQTEVWFGQLIRNLHHWSGNAMVIVVLLHMLRVFFTFAYHHPREFNWLLGISLLLITAGANFTGYLLPWDQRAYWAVTVGASLLQYVPFVGEPLAHFMLGGPEVGATTLTNFYGLHIAVLPMALFAVMSFHIWRARKDGFSIPRDLDEAPPQRIERVTTMPHLVNREVIFGLVVIAVLLVWVSLVDAPLEAAADPAHSPNPAKAAWYFMGIQELLLHFHPFFAAIVIPSLGLLTLLLLPYFDQDVDGEGIWFGTRRGRWLALLGAIVGVAGTVSMVWLDEYTLNLTELLPSLPSAVSNGWIPLAWVLSSLWLYWEILRKLFRAAQSEARLSLFTLLLVSFITLTVIGQVFRGEGMALIAPF